MQIPASYTLLRQETIAELQSEAYILRHNKSGARIFLLSNTDQNKVFTIGFRTPVSDSTGVPHILEHSVLCGSEKFPVKDPFIELEKSSLQTYLNAMTFADKTIYPVASCNDKDFQNLMDVYLDAVLHPMIYRNEKIFQQEGWHYDLESPEGELTINGVVYNEMKGAFSSPEEVLDRYCQSALFPDTTYRFESGGDPANIPDLTYEEFLNFHRRYYHPSNSYIYLYGDMDMEEKLRWMDEAYLSAYDMISVDSEIRHQEPFEAPREEEIFYPLAEEDTPEEQTWLSMQWVLGDILDPILYHAFQVLEYALIGAQGAPLRQALLDAGIGLDVFGGYRNWTLQPYFSVVAKNTEKEKKEAFVSVIEDTLRKIVAEGIEEKGLLAALNGLEFRNREADFGSYPKGLMYGIECFDSWLYDERDPLMHLKYEETFSFLRKNLNTGYFEGLVEKYFLNNPHRALVILSPEAGMGERREQQLKEKLTAYKASLTEAEVEDLIRQTEALAAYQDAAPTKEELDTLPRLTREDIGREISALTTEEKQIGGIPILHHERFAGGILYLRLLYDVREIPARDLPALGIFRSLLCLLDTDKRSYQDLYHEINIHTGGLGSSISCFEQVNEIGRFTPYFEMNVRVLHGELKTALDLCREILEGTQFTDEKRILELLRQFRSRGEMNMANSGHSTAVSRAASYGSPQSWYNEQIGGLDYQRYLEDLTDHFEERKEELLKLLRHFQKTIFAPEKLMVSVTGDAEGYGLLEAELPAYAQYSGEPSPRGELPAFPLERKNEGLKTTAQIQFVARSGNFRKAGLPYTGALRVLRAILGDEYLWNQVRVKGGAYGCMCNFGRSGGGYFVSYRDPHLRRTLEVYESIVEYLKNFTISEEDMTRFIIGVIGTLDRPKNPAEWGDTALHAYLCGVNDTMRQEDRDQVLNCTEADIRALSAHVEAILSQNQLCVVGNAGKIEAEKELFLHTEQLFR